MTINELPELELVIGARCYLNSGSPEMTIRGIGVSAVEGEIGLIQCVWIVNGVVVSGDFPAQCLKSSFPGTRGLMTEGGHAREHIPGSERHG